MPVSSCSDANFSAIGPLLLSAVQKVVNEIKNVSIFVCVLCVVMCGICLQYFETL